MRILIVEDDVDSAEALRALVTVWGHEPTIASEGDAAIRMSLTSQPEVVILDLGLPGGDAFEVACRLRTGPGGTGLRIIALTGHAEPEYRRRALEAGVDTFFLKPTDLDELRECILNPRPPEVGRGNGTSGS